MVLDFKVAVCPVAMTQQAVFLSTRVFAGFPSGSVSSFARRLHRRYFSLPSGPLSAAIIGTHPWLLW